MTQVDKELVVVDEVSADDGYLDVGNNEGPFVGRKAEERDGLGAVAEGSNRRPVRCMEFRRRTVQLASRVMWEEGNVAACVDQKGELRSPAAEREAVDL